MTPDEMKIKLIENLEFWTEEIKNKKHNHSTIIAIKQRQSANISFSVTIKIITWEESLELEKKYNLF